VSWWNDKIIFTGITGGQVINIGIGKFYSTAAIAADRSISATHIIGTFGEEIGKLILTPGSGTSDKPFLIYSEADLKAVGRGNYKGMNWSTSAHYKLRSDFNLTGKDDWVPIGLASGGVFDGNGHTITGLTINGTTGTVGMFGYMYGRVENLRLENVNIFFTSGYIGAIAGENQGTISNCFVSGNVSSGNCGGGLVGPNKGIIQNSFSAANVTGGDNGAGGIAAWSTGIIQNCYSIGTVSGTDLVGGITGDVAGTIINCFAAGAVSGTYRVGGIVGRIISGVVEGNIALNQSITRTSGTSAVFWRIVGSVEGGTHTNNRAWSGIPFNPSNLKTVTSNINGMDGLDVTAADLRTQAPWTAAGFAFGDNETSPWVWQEGKMPRLYWQSENLPWPEHLVDPVTVTIGTTTTPYASLDAALDYIYDAGTGNFTITLYRDQTMTEGRWVNTPYQNITIVGSGGVRTITHGITNPATVMFTIGNANASLTLGDNVTIQGRSTAGNGDVISIQNGTLTMLNGSKITGHSTNNDVISVNGVSARFIMSGGSITGNASSQSVGSFYSGGIYLRSGAVEITGGSIKGNTPTDIAFIPNPAATLNLSGSAEIGVIMLDNSTSDPVISLPGTFTGNVAALNMRRNTGNINDVISSWSGKQIIQAASGYTLTPADIAKFPLGNFYSSAAPQVISPNYLIGTSGADLGKLVALISGPGSGTAADPFNIYNEADLRAVGRGTYNSANWSTSAHYRLMNNITLTGGNWTRIGDFSSGFSGTFNGNGKTITGMTIEASSAGYQGMFCFISPEGVVRNLGLVNVNITGVRNVGSIAGENEGTIENCFVTGSITGTDVQVGGIAGSNIVNGTIQNCYVIANITGKEQVGGITGYASVGIIRNCYVAGTITGGVVSNASGVGGITGCNNVPVQNTVTLLQSIMVTSGNDYNKIIGANLSGGSLTNNRAWSGTTFSPAKTPTSNLTGNDGLSVTAAALKTQATWQASGAAFSFGTNDASPWVWEDGKMPRLHWETSSRDWPTYLQ